MKDRSPYPFLIAVPHGGELVPPEVAGRIALSPEDLRENSDPSTRQIYNLADDVLAMVAFPVARPVLDANRAPSDLPPEHPDGVVKMVTPLGARVYRHGCFPDPGLILILLRRYYYPYHRAVHRATLDGRVRLAFDCHSMLPEAPPLFPDAGRTRPLICLGNRGDPEGRPAGGRETVTCPPEWIEALADCFTRQFPAAGAVRINDPFPGGFTLKFHHRQTKTPWIQIEVNRSLYEDPSGVKQERIALLRRRVRNAVTQFWDEVGAASPD
jgi:N-formylglutamate deformylase